MMRSRKWRWPASASSFCNAALDFCIFAVTALVSFSANGRVLEWAIFAGALCVILAYLWDERVDQLDEAAWLDANRARNREARGYFPKVGAQ